jgi:CheY-like chemotaxis protein
LGRRSGTGLGLAVVYSTIKDHKGYIDVKSAAGEGTTISLYFYPTVEEAMVTEQELPVEQYNGKGERILVVDDLKEQRAIVESILVKLGYSPLSVGSGEEAVEYCREHAIDLIILDMIMDPGIDGLETYRRIAAIRPGQKAIITSGFTETARVLAMQELGAGAFVKKPYSIERLGLAIKEELQRVKA